MKGIEVRHIEKSFKETRVLTDVSMRLEPGKIYGLLGRNGAGKSTLLNLVSNRLFADSGEILIDGENAKENDRAQRKVYLMSEKTLYPKDMKVRDIFRWSGEFYGGFDKDYAARLAGKFGLDVNKKVSQLSTGYSSIYKLITALSLPVPYIFLDEPVLGLDATHRDLFYQVLLENYAENPRMIVISTHLIEEVASVLEHVMILSGGRICRDAPCEELLQSGYTVTGRAAEVEAYIQGREVIGMDAIGGMKTAYLIGEREPGLEDEFEVGPLTLQKLFVKLTSEGEKRT